MEGERRDTGEEWPLRPVLLGGIGLATGLVAHWIIGEGFPDQPSAVELALLTFVIVGAALFGFVVERARMAASAIFAALGGLVTGLIVYWNGPSDSWGSGDQWRLLCLAIALGIAAPLFQAWRREERPRLPYGDVHDHAWTNAVLWAASWVFVGVVFLLAWLLAELFAIIGIEFLRDLLSDSWFWRGLMGLAFGAGLGLLRERDRIVRTLQTVVMAVLGVLAPVLAVGLAAFLLALPFTGLGALWTAWGSAAALLLACVVAGLVLVNAVIGNRAGDEAGNPALRWGAMLLAVVLLPLAGLASLAIGLRIDQYGLTPERLWALTFVGIACAVGLAYLVAVARRRTAFAEAVRPANLNLALGICGVALLLATPIVSFNTIATRDQVARLTSGRVASDKFDWAALAFDFGEPGRAAVARLAKSGEGEIRTAAARALQATNRWDLAQAQQVAVARDSLGERLRVLPKGASIPPGLREVLPNYALCGTGSESCTVAMVSAGEAIVFDDGCFRRMEAKDEGEPRARAIEFDPYGCASPKRAVLREGEWQVDHSRAVTDPARVKAGFAAGDIEVRTVQRRQVFIGDVPVGPAFE